MGDPPHRCSWLYLQLSPPCLPPLCPTPSPLVCLAYELRIPPAPKPDCLNGPCSSLAFSLILRDRRRSSRPHTEAYWYDNTIALPSQVLRLPISLLKWLGMPPVVVTTAASACAPSSSSGCALTLSGSPSAPDRLPATSMPVIPTTSRPATALSRNSSLLGVLYSSATEKTFSHVPPPV